MTDFMKILQQAQGRAQQLQDDLQKLTVTGTSGGGMVTVTADGRGMVRLMKIDKSVVNADDVEMLEDLVVVAVNEAQKKAGELAQEEMKKLTGGLPFKLPF